MAGVDSGLGKGCPDLGEGKVEGGGGLILKGGFILKAVQSVGTHARFPPLY